MKKKISMLIVSFILMTSFAFAAQAEGVYTVKPGDTMWAIAARNGVTVSEILAANPSIKNVSLIYVGQKIYIPATNMTAMENEVLRLVNIERAKRGLGALKMNETVRAVARIKSRDMANKNYFSHYSPTYGSPFDMMKSYGVKFSAAGENIAKGQRTPAAVMNAWMNSPGHRSNILSPSYTEIGIGLAKDKNGVFYWTQMFLRPIK